MTEGISVAADQAPIKNVVLVHGACNLRTCTPSADRLEFQTHVRGDMPDNQSARSGQLARPWGFPVSGRSNRYSIRELQRPLDRLEARLAAERVNEVSPAEVSVAKG